MRPLRIAFVAYRGNMQCGGQGVYLWNLARELAQRLRRETQPFKTDVRKLKKLGLTVSFDVGYELAPRGRAFLERTRRRRV